MPCGFSIWIPALQRCGCWSRSVYPVKHPKWHWNKRPWDGLLISKRHWSFWVPPIPSLFPSSRNPQPGVVHQQRDVAHPPTSTAFEVPTTKSFATPGFFGWLVVINLDLDLRLNYEIRKKQKRSMALYGFSPPMKQQMAQGRTGHSCPRAHSAAQPWKSGLHLLSLNHIESLPHITPPPIRKPPPNHAKTHCQAKLVEIAKPVCRQALLEREEGRHETLVNPSCQS